MTTARDLGPAASTPSSGPAWLTPTEPFVGGTADGRAAERPARRPLPCLSLRRMSKNFSELGKGAKPF